MKKTLLSLLALFTFANSGGCLLTQDNTIHVAWDAFKTDSRITVHGKFTEVAYTPHQREGKNFRALLVGSKVTINSTKIDTSITSRDETVSAFFFKKLSTPTIEGVITAINADKMLNSKARTGILTVEITLNGKTKAVPMQYNYFQEDFSATGSIKLTDFGALDALASIENRCHALYKGKIWDDVTIKFHTKITATLCDSKS